MKIIGLTGGIGSGKSTVSQVLAHLGAKIIDSDKLGHEALQAGGKAQHEVVDTFGKQVLNAENAIDRRKLGEVVFSSPEARKKLEAILHPTIYKMVKAQIENFRKEGANVVVVEVPLLVEAGWQPLVDEVWTTIAPEAVVLRRLKERTGMFTDEAKSRIRAQLSNEERRRHADVVIDTDCTLDELKAKVEELWRERVANS
ncbi:MAG: dephospho-CoA kinase [Dehalococcoidales bacterium]|nr:dephospho-CoA kinase [Dehalococcoidales bacterium]